MGLYEIRKKNFVTQQQQTDQGPLFRSSRVQFRVQSVEYEGELFIIRIFLYLTLFVFF